ncbi:MAG: DUF465 domain-containing protein [Rhodobacterales bacterium]|nr:DUF465 domain-containing protein [Rhodobacterales bacterium]
MSHTPHELTEEFPDKLEKMQTLKETDAHFRKLVEEYHDVNRKIHAAESNVTPMDQFAEEEMRKQRMHLKDEIARLLA